MHQDHPALARRAKRSHLWVLPPLALGFASTLAPACLSRPIAPQDSHLTFGYAERFTQSRVDKIDILLTIDDSASMKDKQELLARAVPDLVDSLANPACVDEDGAVVLRPATPLSDCPAASFREFEPILDIHVGVISTSLGLRGANNGAGCSNDESHLLSRTEGGGTVPTYDGAGFLAWDPARQLEPPGTGDPAALRADLEAMVRGVGEVGCGYEAQLESWYRFLVDPEPYATIERKQVGQGVVTVPTGVDGELLTQRHAFLRPDSLVAVVLLSDENDCSFIAEGQGYFTAEPNSLYKLKARAECAQDANDPCCASCGFAPAACPADPSCSEPLSPDHTRIGYSCFDQKRRFGTDFLYRIDRYVQGLTSTTIPNSAGELVDNPLLVSTHDGARYERPRDRVFLAGIVGVPWQDIARLGGAGTPDLGAGLMSATELRDEGRWDVILGDPASGKRPTDPHMWAQIEERTGTNPVTGEPLAASSAAADADPINGHEWNAAENPVGELQYACIFDLPPAEWIPQGPDCGSAQQAPTWRTPLCQAADGTYDQTQRRAKAYPGLRELEVLRGIEEHAIVASICPAEPVDTTALDYGYRPAIGALVERLKEQLKDPCLQRTFSPDDQGQVGCLIIEGRATNGACDCSGAARSDVPADAQSAVDAALTDPASQALGLDCFCVIDQLEGDALAVCQNVLGDVLATGDGAPVDGWCYVDATTVPPTGNPQLVSHCPATQERTIRFVGDGEVANDGVLFIRCQQSAN